MAQLNLQALLKTMLDKGASDLHITAGSPPRLRIDGDLVKLAAEPLSPVDTKTICYSVMNDAQKLRFEEDLEIDFSFGIRNMARFRANVYMQQACVAGAFRLVPYKIIPLADMHLPPIVTELCDRPRGLVLVTGPTGSGKSTTLASMIDHINKTTKGHIVTVEDPIEFQHTHGNCLVNQREIGRDSTSFKRALKYILRQDPDVVLIGEMRDLETIEAALTVAETGTPRVRHPAHQQRGAEHQPYRRRVPVAPAEPDPGRAVVRARGRDQPDADSQGSGVGRALAAEVMIPNTAIRALIRDDKLHQIYSQMQIGQSKFGMQTMNQCLADLYLRKVISLDECLGHSSDIDELKTMIDKAGGGLGASAPGAQPQARR